MIYTIGNTLMYSKCFAEALADGVPLEKAIGGSVWKYPDEAQTFAHEGYSVYGVEADWDTDTKSTSFEWNELIIDAPLVELDQISYTVLK